jgi:peroxiredoxin
MNVNFVSIFLPRRITLAATPSTMRALGTAAPTFSLPDTTGKTVFLSDFTGKPVLVAFICNHCPYVKHIGDKLGEVTADLARRDVGVVLINSNDVSVQPEDAPERMPEFMKTYGISVPYLFDETQDIAEAYQAACTPDFFLFDKDHRLVYRGQFDDSRPGNDIAVTGSDLRAAADALLAGKPVSPDQKASVGCNIKWKPGKAPAITPLK